MIAVQDPEVAARLRRLRQHAMDVSDLARHGANDVVIESYPERGWNQRMTDMQATLGLCQLEVLDEILAERAAARRPLHGGDRARSRTSSRRSSPSTPSAPGSPTRSGCARGAPIERNELMRRLLPDGVPTRRGVMAIHEERAYAGVDVDAAAHRGGHARVADAAAVRRSHGRAAGPRDRLPGRPPRRRSRRERTDADRPASARRAGSCAPRGAAGVATRLPNRAPRSGIAPPGSGRCPSRATISCARRDRRARLGRCRRRLPSSPGEPLDDRVGVRARRSAGSGGHTTMFRLVSALEQAGHDASSTCRTEHGWALEQHARRSGRGGRGCGPRCATRPPASRTRTRSSPPAGRPRIRSSPRPRGAPLLPRPGLRAVRSIRRGARRCSPRRRTASASTASRPAAGSPSACGATTACRPTTSTSAAIRVTRSTARPAPRERARASASTRGPRRRAGRSSSACSRSTCSPRATPRSRSTCSAERMKGLPFAATNHGLLTPEQLNALYNRCVAGLVLSATNVSLVPHEMLAAGCIPVVNDAEQNRIVLDNSTRRLRARHAVRARRRALELVERPRRRARAAAEAAAASVHGSSWDDAGATVERIVRREVEGGRPARLRAVGDARPTADRQRRRPVLPVRTLPPRLRRQRARPGGRRRPRARDRRRVAGRQRGRGRSAWPRRTTASRCASTP